MSMNMPQENASEDKETSNERIVGRGEQDSCYMETARRLSVFSRTSNSGSIARQNILGAHTNRQVSGSDDHDAKPGASPSVGQAEGSSTTYLGAEMAVGRVTAAASAASGTTSRTIPPTDNVIPLLTADDRIRLEELRARARVHINDAIQTIPLEKKEAFLEAMEMAPYLFECETDPLQFLRRCDYDVAKAAERLCVYWKERRELFGADRAFLPLTLTGDGALSKDDVLSLQAGFPALLPEASNGTKIVFFDRRQLVPSLTSENRLRTLFYLMKIMAQDEKSQIEGIIMMILLFTPRSQTVDYPFVRKVFHLTVNAMPVKAKWHMLIFPPKPQGTTKQYKVQDLICAYIDNLMQIGLKFEEDMFFHFEREGGDIMQILEMELSLHRNSIPHFFGGTWNFVECMNWCRKQSLQEREQFKWTLMAANKIKKSKHAGAAASGVTGNSADGTDAIASNDDEMQQRLSKKRANNVLQSRRKRERQRQEMVSLTNECEVLRNNQKRLKLEESRLKRFWNQAQNQIRELKVVHQDAGGTKPSCVPSSSALTSHKSSPSDSSTAAKAKSFPSLKPPPKRN